MATRAGAGTGMLVSLVVFVVATVALLVVSIVLFTGKSKAEDAEKASQATLAQVITTEERNRDAVRAMLGDATSNRQSLYAAMAQRASDVATFVAGNPGATLADMQRDLAVPEGQTVRTVLGNERSQVRRLSQDLETMQTRLASANDESKKLQGTITDMERQHAAALADARKSLDAFAKTVEDLRGQTSDAVQGIDEVRQRIENRYAQRVRDLEGQVDQLNQDNAVLRTRVAELDAKVGEVRPKPQSPAEIVDGEVLDVVGAERQVFINLGRQDRIVPGMTFEVYADSRGISVDPKTGNYSRGKASIQVIKVGDGTSTARITRETTGSPVVPGDVIANAVFDANTKFKFLVFGKFDLDGDGRATEAEAEYIRQRVRDWGGIVLEGDDLTGDLDFLVLGVQPPQPGPIPPNASAQQIQARLEAQDEYDRYDRLFRRATEAQIPVLNATRFEILTGSTPR
ncbi:MAG: hypothetical protein FJ257_05965 [Phycisphaerae bacterium]|nr:hypothetical protein [Phycisphaerae bacterium]